MPRGEPIDWAMAMLNVALVFLAAATVGLIVFMIVLIATGGFDTPGCHSGQVRIVTGHELIVTGKTVVNEPLYSCGKVVHISGTGQAHGG